MFKRLALSTLVAAAALSGCSSLNTTPAPKVNNVIFMIGDGMGPAFITAHRYDRAGEPGRQVEPTIFDQLLVGMAATHPAEDTWVTDSAASATALASGVKSYNGAVGVDTDKLPVRTMLEQARKAGMHTGVVATSEVNHATPAGFVANVASRRMYEIIAEQYVNKRIADQSMLDLMIGGGQRYFPREEGGLAEQLAEQGFQQAWSLEEMTKLDALPAMALMSDRGMPFAIDTDTPKRLSLMTDKALELLDGQDKGFFLMVEGSQIDWCGHANDIRCALGEMQDFAKAVERAKAYVDDNPDTLLVITADHSTGGLTLGSQGEYAWLPTAVNQVSRTSSYIAEAMLAEPERSVASHWQDHAKMTLSESQLAAIEEARERQVAGEGRYTLSNAISKAVADNSYTGWTTSGHTAVDVTVMAYGPGAEQFAGYQDNTDIAKKLMGLMAR
ncbi:alkaline phosphatase [Ferrimonas marina]|uniref:Alkaline phosphatase n=1 Tax=Ferrimonas marina TaxID=299255 RepID=A0A1M5NUR9_9GAMM|nr:alkaline phosphatase [Ferrimonas marina]SHG93324.1 alkaline phosphatase [Ferrimonas marina]